MHVHSPTRATARSLAVSTLTRAHVRCCGPGEVHQRPRGACGSRRQGGLGCGGGAPAGGRQGSRAGRGGGGDRAGAGHRRRAQLHGRRVGGWRMCACVRARHDCVFASLLAHLSPAGLGSAPADGLCTTIACIHALAPQVLKRCCHFSMPRRHRISGAQPAQVFERIFAGLVKVDRTLIS